MSTKLITWHYNLEKLIRIISSQNSYNEQLPEIFSSKWNIQIEVHRIGKRYKIACAENETISPADKTSAINIRRHDYLLKFFLIRDSDLKLKHTSVEANFLVHLTGVNKKVDIIKDLIPYHIGNCIIRNFDEIDYQIYLHLTFIDVLGTYDRLSHNMEVCAKEGDQTELKKHFQFVKKEKEEDLIDNNVLKEDIRSWERAVQSSEFCELSGECIPAGSFELNIPCKKDIQTKGTNTNVLKRTNAETPSHEIPGQSWQKKVNKHVFNNVMDSTNAKMEHAEKCKQIRGTLKAVLGKMKIQNEFCQQSGQLVPQKNLSAEESLENERTEDINLCENPDQIQNTETNEQLQQNLESRLNENMHLCELVTQDEEAENTGQKELIKYSLNELIEINKDFLLKPSKETTSKIVNISKICKINLMRKQTEDHKKEFTKLNLETTERIKLNITEETQFSIQNKEIESQEENNCTKMVEQKVIEANQIFEQSLKMKLNEQDKNHGTENKDLLEQSKDTSVNLVDQIKARESNLSEQKADIEATKVSNKVVIESDESENSDLPEQNQESEKIKNSELSKELDQISTNGMIHQNKTYQPIKLTKQIEDTEAYEMLQRILEADTEIKSSNSVVVESKEAEEIQILKSEFILNKVAYQSKNFESNKQTEETVDSKMNEMEFLYSTLEHLAKRSNKSENSEPSKQNKENVKIKNRELSEKLVQTSTNKIIDQNRTFQPNKLVEQMDTQTNEMLEKNSETELDIKVDDKSDDTERNSKNNEDSNEQNSSTDSGDLIEENDQTKISEILEQNEKEELNETSDFFVEKHQLNVSLRREDVKSVMHGDLSCEKSETNVEKQVDLPQLMNKENEEPEINFENTLINKLWKSTYYIKNLLESYIMY